MKVTNINGTTDNKCKCGSWLDHWKNFSGQQLPLKCPVYFCDNTPTDGGHVQRESYLDRSWYIIPLCKAHNGMKGETLAIYDNVTLVSANVSETCGKTK